MSSFKHAGLIISIITSLISCTHNKNYTTTFQPELAKAEAIMYRYPDSALHILQGIQPDNPSNNEQYATWALLMTQAQYKNQIEQSDSLINIAYSYFINQDNAQRKALALYYKGILCHESHHAEDALSFYLEATTEIEKTNDYQLGFLINSEIGLMYLYRKLNDYAMEYFEKAHHNAELSNNQTYIAFSFIYIARAFSQKKQYNKAIEYYEKAIKIGQVNNYPTILASAMNETSFLFLKTGENKKALQYAKDCIKIKKTDQRIFSLGDTYRYLKMYDSAYFYLNQASLSPNIHTARSAYQALFYISQEEKDYKKAVEYSNKLWFYQDSIGKTDRNKALIEMQEKYDQQKIINENNLSQIKKDRIIRNVLIALIILSFIIAITNYLYQRKIVSQKQEILEKEEKIRYFTMKIHENETLINRNKMRIEELTIQMEGSQEIKEQWKEQNKIRQEIQQQNEMLKLENNKLQNHISNYAQSLKEKSKELEAMEHLSEENQYLHKREAFLCNQLINQTELFNKLKTTKYIDDQLWQEIKEKIDLLFDNYTKRLYHQIPSLTDGDIQICCLIKLRFSNGDIANMLAISPTSVSKRKLRLKERIVQEIGSLGENQSLDLWLMEY
ncbi:tetratricopeptide repeat protein [Phocaeicola dorei]|nr:tetratricopeptide repeat protein [Phocaeicola dorei]MCB6963978.1 tetratricopeptide repeat protein [Phocaeicola dorei]MCG4613283.1 tetratricopeptide repeat protein [Phocaeicola dorei]MCG4637119.1 tetratricopeptide repeat protein [Phocaeicola dorei]MCS2696826.1 tetratricopeptide repeat protein [Phocaeicola dorei]